MACNERCFSTSEHHILPGIQLLICFLIWLLLGIGAPLADPVNPEASMDKEIRLATLQDLYPSVNQHDARMALELIMQKTIIRRSYPYSIKLNFIDQQSDVVATIKRGGYHYVTLSGMDYVFYKEALNLTPVLIPSKGDRPTEVLLFLVKKGQTLNTIARREERLLILESGRSGDLSKVWLDTMLSDRKMSTCDRFFTKIRRVKKPSRAVLPVFFNQADACVITQEALEVLEELNPQIERQVGALFKSEGLVRMVICATSRPDLEDTAALIRESINLERNTDTQQAMTIIQMKRFLPFAPQDLEATIKLLANRNALAGR